MSYGMVINLKRCVGCNGCRTACKMSNGTPPNVTRAKVNVVDEGTYPNARRTFVPMLCMHCESAPCVAVCPEEGATYKREEDGIVVVDKSKCIGCKLCMDACPYGARYYIEDSKGYFGEELSEFERVAYENMPEKTVDKCDFCLGNGRLEKGEPQACVKACQANARIFGKLEDLQEIIKSNDAYQLLPEEGTSPSVWYTPNIYY